MNHVLPLVWALAVLIPAPAQAQYLYLDVNGDGLNFDREMAIGNNSVASDMLGPAVTAIDVWLVTDQMADGSAAGCAADPNKSMTLQAYTLILRTIGTGIVTFHGWTDNLGFDTPYISGGDGTFVAAGQDAWFGRGTNSPGLSPGAYKLGTISVSVTGIPVVSFATSSTINGEAQTAFLSACDGARHDNTLRLGPQGDPDYDFSQSFGTGYFDDVVQTTWGKIKERYR